jgi:RimJ/RimL family protein N-acetyltransferase
MIAELTLDEYEKAKSFFPGLEFELLFSALLEGNSLAQIYVDNRSQPKSVFLWDKANNVFYLSGDESNTPFNTKLSKTIYEQMRPVLLLHRPYFRLRLLSSKWDQKLPFVLRHAQLRRGCYMFLSHQKAVGTDWIERMPLGFTLERIDENFLYSPRYKNVEFVVREILQMWPSIDRFITFGFGFSLVTKDRVACFCTSEYVSKDKCGIGIETLQEYRNKGLATVAASALVQHCQHKGITPYWECNVENLASKRAAAKVGFVKELTYPMHLGKFS